MELKFSKNYKRSYQNILSQYPNLKFRIRDMLNDFDKHLFESKYFRKRFKVGRREITELEFGGDWRCLCEVEIINNKIYLLNIGSHSSLELSSRKNIKI